MHLLPVLVIIFVLFRMSVNISTFIQSVGTVVFNQVNQQPVSNNSFFSATSAIDFNTNFQLVCAGFGNAQWEFPNEDPVPSEPGFVFFAYNIKSHTVRLERGDVPFMQMEHEGYYLCAAEDENMNPQKIRIGLFADGRGIKYN